MKLRLVLAATVSMAAIGNCASNRDQTQWNDKPSQLSVDDTSSFVQMAQKTNSTSYSRLFSDSGRFMCKCKYEEKSTVSFPRRKRVIQRNEIGQVGSTTIITVQVTRTTYRGVSSCVGKFEDGGEEQFTPEFSSNVPCLSKGPFQCVLWEEVGDEKKRPQLC